MTTNSKSKFFTKAIWKLVLLFLVWRGSLFLLPAAADWLTAYRPTFPYAENVLQRSQLPRWIYSWGNFDGVHYITIAQKGYKGTGLIQAFFPIYPLLIAGLNLLVNNTLVSGLLISNLAAFLALVFGFRFISQQFDRQTGWWFVVSLLSFPTSFYLGAMYTESLFLLLIFAGLWYGLKQKNLILSILSGLASGVRLVGIFLLPLVGLKIAKLNFPLSLKKLKKLSKWWWVLITASSGLWLYMLYLWIEFGDPLYFFHVQAEFGAGRQESIILLPQVIYRYLKILWTVRPIDWKYFSYVQDLVLTILAIIALCWSYLKNTVDRSYYWYAVPALLLPTLTGTLSSMPRYLLVIFPLFIFLAQKMKQSVLFRWVYLVVSLCLLVINTMLFIQGRWVA